jgi:hypothetical protein
MGATHALAAGAVPTAQDFVAVACGAVKPTAALRYDAGLHAARLSRALQPGDLVAGIPSSMMDSIRPGETLYVQAHVGPVVVQRPVEALQPANPGQKLFVRAPDGTVMSVLYSGGAG